MIRLTPSLYKRLLTSPRLNAEWNDAWYKTILFIRLRHQVYEYGSHFHLFMCDNEPLQYLCELLEDLLKQDPIRHLYAVRRITSKITPDELRPCTPDDRLRFDAEIAAWRIRGGISLPAELADLSRLIKHINKPAIGKQCRTKKKSVSQ